MKSADEWQNIFGKFPVDQKQEDEVYRLAKLPESLLPPVSFWNSVLTELDIKQIQLDAWKQGMTDAAGVVSDRIPVSTRHQGIIPKAIEQARDSKTTL